MYIYTQFIVYNFLIPLIEKAKAAEAAQVFANVCHPVGWTCGGGLGGTLRPLR